MATDLKTTSNATVSRGLIREHATREIRVTETQQASIAVVANNQRKSLAELVGKSFRKCQSRRGSLEMDDLTLHSLCLYASKMMGGDTAHTTSTNSISFGDSLSSFQDDTYPFEDDKERRTSNIELSLIDTELQREEMERIEQQNKRASNPDEKVIGPELIEVSPGICFPLRGSKETWKAMLDGRLTVTRCCTCQEELTCVDDAVLVICTVCWVFSPVDQSVAGVVALEHEEEDWIARGASRGVGLGVRAAEMQEWITSQQEGSV
jgi:hypothetical protein